jgi:hypothetical protein
VAQQANLACARQKFTGTRLTKPEAIDVIKIRFPAIKIKRWPSLARPLCACGFLAIYIGVFYAFKVDLAFDALFAKIVDGKPLFDPAVIKHVNANHCAVGLFMLLGFTLISLDLFSTEVRLKRYNEVILRQMHGAVKIGRVYWALHRMIWTGIGAVVMFLVALLLSSYLTFRVNESQKLSYDRNLAFPNCPLLPSEKIYTTAKNESLWSIANEQLGDANRWSDIVAINKDKYPSLESSPDFLAKGWDLVMPRPCP